MEGGRGGGGCDSAAVVVLVEVAYKLRVFFGGREGDGTSSLGRAGSGC